MYNVIVYVPAIVYNDYLTLIQYFYKRGDFNVIGVVSDHIDVTGEIDGFKVLRPNDCSSMSYDYILGSGDILDRYKKLNIPNDKIISIHALRTPYFDFNKYVQLLKNPITIFSVNCWAGLCYHYLHLPFSSPTINLFFTVPEFNKFLKNLDYYLSLPLKHIRDEFEHNLKRNYPVCSLGDLTLHFNHYTTFDEANSAWERRKKRININNILAISVATDNLRDAAIEFDSLPIKNKIIFTSYKLAKEVSCSYPLNYPASSNDDLSKLSMYVNESAFGATSFINLYALLFGEKKFKRTN